jgi:hypothetical protein
MRWNVGGHYAQGVKTVVALNGTSPGAEGLQGEVVQFVAYPDEYSRHGNLYVGDPRAALVPLLAHKVSKSFLGRCPEN